MLFSPRLSPYPAGIGGDPHHATEARSRIESTLAARSPIAIRADRSGYLQAVGGEALLTVARDCGCVVEQRIPLGDFVVRGMELARATSPGGDIDRLADAVRATFLLGEERTLVQDVGFPIRQLVDVALRALSPSLNDPTTAENAMGSLADVLSAIVRKEEIPARARIDSEGAPRFLALAPTLDDLVTLGFEQVRIAAAPHPVVARRLIALLEELGRAAAESGRPLPEAERQIALLRDAQGKQAVAHSAAPSSEAPDSA